MIGQKYRLVVAVAVFGVLALLVYWLFKKLEHPAAPISGNTAPVYKGCFQDPKGASFSINSQTAIGSGDGTYAQCAAAATRMKSKYFGLENLTSNYTVECHLAGHPDEFKALLPSTTGCVQMKDGSDSYYVSGPNLMAVYEMPAN